MIDTDTSTLDEEARTALDVLRDIVSAPTAPFHEERVAAAIGAYLHAWAIPYDIDTWGNIVAHHGGSAAGRARLAARPLALMAHMDHPGFEITAAGGLQGAHLTARLLGGVAHGCFTQPVPVRVYPTAGAHVAADLARGTGATIAGHGPGAGGHGLDLYLILDDPTVAPHLIDGWGVWALPDMELHGDYIHARAIDDLAGCAAALLVLHTAVEESLECEVFAIFTRAEEVGLVGARAALQGGSLPRDTYIISLEASKELPGAVQGQGPVIRVGDRRTTFDDSAEGLLRAAASRLRGRAGNENSPGAGTTRADPPRVQRQLMNGGTCEATVAMQAGYAATGLAFPLGNYHNQGPDATLAPEYIHAADFLMGVALLRETARLLSDDDLATAADPESARTTDATERLAQSAPLIVDALS